MAKYKGCTVNGIRACAKSEFKDYDKLASRIEALIPQAKEIAKGIIGDNIGRGNAYEFGSRWRSGITQRVIGFVVESISDEVLLNYVVAGALDAASADNWYMYEKDWGEQ